jgi:hypothetical protein
MNVKPTLLTLSTFLIALAGSAAALAQGTPSTPAGAASTLPDAVAEPAPPSRQAVIAETLEAARAGEIPAGEAGTTTSAPMGGPTELGQAEAQAAEASPLPESRMDVQQETEAARDAGEIPKGEAAVPVKP